MKMKMYLIVIILILILVLSSCAVNRSEPTAVEPELPAIKPELPAAKPVFPEPIFIEDKSRSYDGKYKLSDWSSDDIAEILEEYNINLFEKISEKPIITVFGEITGKPGFDLQKEVKLYEERPYSKGNSPQMQLSFAYLILLGIERYEADHGLPADEPEIPVVEPEISGEKAKLSDLSSEEIMEILDSYDVVLNDIATQKEGFNIKEQVKYVEDHPPTVASYIVIIMHEQALQYAIDRYEAEHN
jgi:hypothetical protein